MHESRADRGWRAWSTLEWVLFGGLGLVVGAHVLSVGAGSWPVWARLAWLAVTVLLALWMMGLLSRDRAQGYLLLTLLGGTGLLKPAISGRELWTSFYETWGEMATVLLGIQLGGSVLAVVAGSLLYSRERASIEKREEHGPSGQASQE